MTIKPAAMSGTPEMPWDLKTPPGTTDFQAWRDPTLDPPALVVQVGKTQLRYHLSCIEDLHAMLMAYGDWMPLGSADEQKPAADGTVEAWGRRRQQPGKGLVRHQEGIARSLWHVRAADAGSLRPGRGRAQPKEQSHAREVANSEVTGSNVRDRESRRQGRSGRRAAARQEAAGRELRLMADIRPPLWMLILSSPPHPLSCAAPRTSPSVAPGFPRSPGS